MFNTQRELSTTLATGIYCQMLVRACKHVLSSELRGLGTSAPVAPVIVTFINNVLQPHVKGKARAALMTRIITEVAVVLPHLPFRHSHPISPR